LDEEDWEGSEEENVAKEDEDEEEADAGEECGRKGGVRCDGQEVSARSVPTASDWLKGIIGHARFPS
jgi:hypothetical protein